MKKIAKIIVAAFIVTGIAAFGFKNTSKSESVENATRLDKNSEQGYFIKRDKL